MWWFCYSLSIGSSFVECMSRIFGLRTLSTEQMNCLTLVLVHTFVNKCTIVIITDCIIICAGNTLSKFIVASLLTVIKLINMRNEFFSSIQIHFYQYQFHQPFGSTRKLIVTVRVVWYMRYTFEIKVESQSLTAILHLSENRKSIHSFPLILVLQTDNPQPTTKLPYVFVFPVFIVRYLASFFNPTPKTRLNDRPNIERVLYENDCFFFSFLFWRHS